VVNSALTRLSPSGLPVTVSASSLRWFSTHHAEHAAGVVKNSGRCRRSVGCWHHGTLRLARQSRPVRTAQCSPARRDMATR
jgi:hypothetical protein